MTTEELQQKIDTLIEINKDADQDFWRLYRQFKKVRKEHEILLRFIKFYADTDNDFFIRVKGIQYCAKNALELIEKLKE